MPQVSFGDKLREIREFRRYSMRQLAKVADVPYETIFRLETGKHTGPRWDVAVRLGKSLGVPLDFFAGEPLEIEETV